MGRRKIDEVLVIRDAAKPGEEITCMADLPFGVPFSLSCTVCDCDSPESYELAVLRGWKGIIYDPDGLSWNFIGCCPDHSEGH